uniref:CLASP_N domain-containing protein n=1 Tax=Anisakis simplex TaxID=6269 RepID=A0A0M3KFE1_ANISI
LIGLAMTTDEQVLSDCLIVAGKYRIDEWNICESTLEYVLTDPEYALQQIAEIIRDVQFAKLLSGHPDVVVPIMMPHLHGENDAEHLADTLRKLPNGSEICEQLCRSMLKSSRDIKSGQRCRMICRLLNDDIDGVIDMLGTLPLSDEEKYLDEVLSGWNADSKWNGLKSALASRLEVIKCDRSSRETTPMSSSFDLQSSGSGSFSTIVHRRTTKR